MLTFHGNATIEKGPNTGGMGAYAPTPLVTPQLLAEIHSKVLKPTVDGMRREGRQLQPLI